MTKTYSLTPDLIEQIATLARDLGKKQSQIIKEAIEEYADYIYDRANAARYDAIVDAYDCGETRAYTLEEIEAANSVRLKTAS
ncbi:MAG: ribbon-helix-helix domain-containing protein [Helicobacteraceae bacterium]|jgi:predicted transcriptional regulator|nr:ribbon-helix-helix domain-containing protein [Helicobacteraceae bacterium]